MSRQAEVSPDWIEWLLRGLVLVVVVSSMALLWRFILHKSQSEERQAAATRTSILSSYGDSKTTEAAYDLTSQCLGNPQFNEDASTLVARCQALSLSFLDKGSFPEVGKEAAHHLITDLSTRYIQQQVR